MLSLTLNGAERGLADLQPDASLADLIASLGFRQDRVALERNGEIVPKAEWDQVRLCNGDRIELVHFVGGGSS